MDTLAHDHLRAGHVRSDSRVLPLLEHPFNQRTSLIIRQPVQKPVEVKPASGRNLLHPLHVFVVELDSSPLERVTSGRLDPGLAEAVMQLVASDREEPCCRRRLPRVEPIE